MGPSCTLGIARFDPAQEKKNDLKRTYKVSISWTTSAIRKAEAEKQKQKSSQNKENINDSREFIMLQKQLVSFESLKTINNYYSVALNRALIFLFLKPS